MDICKYWGSGASFVNKKDHGSKALKWPEVFLDNVIFHFYKGGAVNPLTGPPGDNCFSGGKMNTDECQY